MPVDFPERADEEDTSIIPGRVQFRHDPRLLLPNEMYYTPEQVCVFYLHHTVYPCMLLSCFWVAYTDHMLCVLVDLVRIQLWFQQ